MNINKQIKQVFGLKKCAPKDQQEDPQGNSLELISYPSLYHISFFITQENLSIWKNQKTIHFPNRCCYCNQAEEVFLPYYQFSGFLFSRKKKLLLKRIPHCEQHAKDKLCKLIVFISHWSQSLIHISLIGQSLDFLNQTKIINQSATPLPPWLAFPENNTVSSAWRQGNGEYWWINEWLPFWEGLSSFDKEQYLLKHKAPQEWCDFLVNSSTL